MSAATKRLRPLFGERKILLRGEPQRDLAIGLLRNVPLDFDYPLEVIVREEVKARTLDQNAAYHAGPLRDISKQAWIDGRQYSTETLHEHFRQEYMPDETRLSADELAKRVKNPATYKKWDYDLRGNQICVGSTTQLTKFGFGEFMTKVEAFGAGLGVQFSANPRGGC